MEFFSHVCQSFIRLRLCCLRLGVSFFRLITLRLFWLYCFTPSVTLVTLKTLSLALICYFILDLSLRHLVTLGISGPLLSSFICYRAAYAQIHHFIYITFRYFGCLVSSWLVRLSRFRNCTVWLLSMLVKMVRIGGGGLLVRIWG